MLVLYCIKISITTADENIISFIVARDYLPIIEN